MDQELRDDNSSRNMETVIAIEEACSIEIDCNDNDNEVVVGNQRVCRVCHLSSKESGMSTAELIELGCGCRGELGDAHSQCAEAWFRVKGNRMCEICGETARNVSGGCDNRFMEEWNEGRWIDGGDSNGREDGSRRRCLQGQPFCNLLMACLVIAFILPWFFRVNLF